MPSVVVVALEPVGARYSVVGACGCLWVPETRSWGLTWANPTDPEACIASSTDSWPRSPRSQSVPDAPRTSRSSCCATNSPSSPPIDRPALNDDDRTLLGAIAAALPRRLRDGWIVTPDTCCDGTADASPATGPTHPGARDDHQPLPSSAGSSCGSPPRTRPGDTGASTANSSASATDRRLDRVADPQGQRHRPRTAALDGDLDRVPALPSRRGLRLLHRRHRQLAPLLRAVLHRHPHPRSVLRRRHRQPHRRLDHPSRPQPVPPPRRPARPMPEPWSATVAASSSTPSTRSSEPKASRSSRRRSGRRSRTRSPNAGSEPSAASSSTAPSSGTTANSNASSSTTSTTTTSTGPTAPSTNDRHSDTTRRRSAGQVQPPSSRQIHPMRRPHQRIPKRRLTSHDRVSGTHSLYWKGPRTPVGMPLPRAFDVGMAIAGPGAGPACVSAAAFLGLTTQVPSVDTIAVPGRTPTPPARGPVREPLDRATHPRSRAH